MPLKQKQNDQRLLPHKQYSARQSVPYWKKIAHPDLTREKMPGLLVDAPPIAELPDLSAHMNWRKSSKMKKVNRLISALLPRIFFQEESNFSLNYWKKCNLNYNL